MLDPGSHLLHGPNRRGSGRGSGGRTFLPLQRAERSVGKVRLAHLCTFAALALHKNVPISQRGWYLAAASWGFSSGKRRKRRSSRTGGGRSCRGLGTQRTISKGCNDPHAHCRTTDHNLPAARRLVMDRMLVQTTSKDGNDCHARCA